MAEERAPDHSKDPRDQETGQGYPETNPEGSSPAEGTEEGPEAGAGTGNRNADAPKRPDPDSDSDVATGNPRAAG